MGPDQGVAEMSRNCPAAPRGVHAAWRHELGLFLRIPVVICSCVLLSSCAEKGPESGDKELTRRQRDSVLAETPLPGAKTVGRAIAVSDSAAARAKRLDDQTDQPE